MAVDLFAGVGGFSLGMEQAGFDVAVAVEQDPVHGFVYAFNFPQTKVLVEDIRKLSGEAIKKAVQERLGVWTGDIDLVFGGPPCQGFSIMGKRSVEDERNDLVFHFCRLVKELQPRYFVMENVPGITTKRYSSYFTQLQENFQAAGYHTVKPKVLNAAHFGVPQNRRRLFLLGYHFRAEPIAYPIGNVSISPTVKEALQDLPNLDEFLELRYSDAVQLTSKQLASVTRKASVYVRMLRELRSDVQNLAIARKWDRRWLTSSIQTQHNESCILRFSQMKPGELDKISRLRRLDWNGRSHTLRAGTNSERGSFTSPRPIHPQYPRVISVREAARLHSFPDWFRFHVTKWHGFRQVGNAVPPLLGRAVGQQVISSLKVTPFIPEETLHLGDPAMLKLTPSQAIKHWQP